MSPAKDLGTKYCCWKCETRFYDLRKATPLCPKCGADQRESPALRAPTKESKRAAAKAASRAKEPVVVPAALDDDEAPTEDVDDDGDSATGDTEEEDDS